MNLNARQIIKLRQMENQKIENLWCEAQQQDFENMISLMENVADAAMSCSKGAQGRHALEQAKSEFIGGLIKSAEKYRIITTEKVNS